MNTDFTDQLRSQMGQVRIQVPPGLARQAHRRYRRRRLAVRAAVASGAAVVIGAGTAVAAGVTRTTPAIPQGQTAAYVVSHVSSALAATRAITYTTTQTDAPGAAVNGQHRLDWAYGTRLRSLDEAANGTKRGDAGFSEEHGRLTTVQVNYQNRTWSRTVRADALPSTPDLCGPLRFPAGVGWFGTPANLISAIRSGVRCGTIRVTGRQVIDGIDAIKLAVATTPATIWVNPRTYLPMQIVVRPEHMYVTAANGKLVPVKEERTRFTWLPPTRANLAQLTVPIPPGFRQVSG